MAPRAPAYSLAGTDKSQLPLPEPSRLRDKAHLKFVASQRCLVCGRLASEPHHLRFAQPRAIRMEVSDAFTVPLCRGHHRQLYRAANEVAWWEDLDIKSAGDREGALGADASKICAYRFDPGNNRATVDRRPDVLCSDLL